MPRGVNDIDVMVLPIASHCRTGNGDTTLSLLLHPVGGRLAFMHLANLMRQPCPVEDTLRSSRLAGINVCDDPDIAKLAQGDLIMICHMPSLNSSQSEQTLG